MLFHLLFLPMLLLFCHLFLQRYMVGSRVTSISLCSRYRLIRLLPNEAGMEVRSLTEFLAYSTLDKHSLVLCITLNVVGLKGNVPLCNLQINPGNNFLGGDSNKWKTVPDSDIFSSHTLLDNFKRTLAIYRRNVLFTNQSISWTWISMTCAYGSVLIG